ncbi:MAG: hypothetical protein WCG47_24755, partial [Dermatophilaceae bacterium]
GLAQVSFNSLTRSLFGSGERVLHCGKAAVCSGLDEVGFGETRRWRVAIEQVPGCDSLIWPRLGPL